MTRIVFADVETTHLDPQVGHIWELALIVRDPDTEDVEYLWRIRPDLANADPTALRVGRYYERNREPAPRPGSVYAVEHPEIRGSSSAEATKAFPADTEKAPACSADEITTGDANVIGRSADEIRAALMRRLRAARPIGCTYANPDDETHVYVSAAMEIVGPLIAELNGLRQAYDATEQEASEQRLRAEHLTEAIGVMSGELDGANRAITELHQRAERAENNEQATRNAFNAQADLLERTADERDRLRKSVTEVRALAKGWIARGESAAMPSPFVARGREVLAAIDGPDGSDHAEA